MTVNKTYKITFTLTAILSILFFLVNEIYKMGAVIDLGMGILLGIITVLLVFFIWLYLRSEDERIKQKNKMIKM